MRLLLACVLVASCSVGGIAFAPPAMADGTSCVGLNDVDTEGVERATEAGQSFEDLQMAAAQGLVRRRTGESAGHGVSVALIDSGTPNSVSGVRQASEVSVVPVGENGYVWWSGPAMAGLITGQVDDGVPVGFAPGASLINIRAYDVGPGGEADDELKIAGVQALVTALERVPRGVDIVTVAHTVVPTDDAERRSVERAVDRLTDRGVVVVAAAGDRPAEGQPGYGAAGEADPGEDHAGLFYPAALAEKNRRVLAVTSTADPDGALGAVVPSSAVSLAVPTYGAVTYSLVGRTCQIDQISSATAAAEVSGILALLLSYYDDRGENIDQVVARLLATAAGSPNADLPDVRVGAGVAQPLDALTRELRPRKSGAIDGAAPMPADALPAVLPEPEADRLASTRDDLVTWGLIGGLVLVLVLVLRPVFARRRS